MSTSFSRDTVSAKIYTGESELSQELQERKKHGDQVVFTNGCFDIIHTGHTRYLQEARLLGDCLVVGVNSNESVSRLKGDKRPIIPIAERLEILAGFLFVDYVISFSDDTPFNLIRALRPSILVKGGDWPVDQIVGRDLVESDGGKVMTIPEIEGKATTRIIELIIDRYK